LEPLSKTFFIPSPSNHPDNVFCCRSAGISPQDCSNHPFRLVYVAGYDQ
jgi:hypothetical protein